jgi:hypothetical protein
MPLLQLTSANRVTWRPSVSNLDQGVAVNCHTEQRNHQKAVNWRSNQEKNMRGVNMAGKSTHCWVFTNYSSAIALSGLNVAGFRKTKMHWRSDDSRFGSLPPPVLFGGACIVGIAGGASGIATR